MSWVSAAIAGAATVAGSLLSGDGDGDSGSNAGEIKNHQITELGLSDTDIMYRDEAVRAMDSFAEYLNTITETDRSFFENTFLPFQNSIINTNKNLLPSIERVAGATLEESSRDLVGNDPLKAVLRQRTVTGDEAVETSFASLQENVAKIPTTEERVSQALASVEGQFSQAGKELSREYQARGQAVTQASQRSLAFEKAKAKAGAAGFAEEASRTEQIAGAGKLLEGSLAAQAGSAQAEATRVGALTQLQQAQQAGLATPQVGGVDKTTGLEAAELAGGITTTAGLQTFGTRQREDDFKQVERGLSSPNFTSGATGQLPTSATSGLKSFNPSGPNQNPR